MNTGGLRPDRDLFPEIDERMEVFRAREAEEAAQEEWREAFQQEYLRWREARPWRWIPKLLHARIFQFADRHPKLARLLGLPWPETAELEKRRARQLRRLELARRSRAAQDRELYDFSLEDL